MATTVLEQYLIDAAKHALRSAFRGDVDECWISSTARLKVLGESRAQLAMNEAESSKAMLDAFEAMLAGRPLPFDLEAQQIVLAPIATQVSAAR